MIETKTENKILKILNKLNLEKYQKHNIILALNCAREWNFDLWFKGNEGTKYNKTFWNKHFKWNNIESPKNLRYIHFDFEIKDLRKLIISNEDKKEFYKFLKVMGNHKESSVYGYLYNYNHISLQQILYLQNGKMVCRKIDYRFKNYDLDFML